jgi:hypothetical protein
MSKGVYFIENKTTSDLKISASYNGEKIIFLDSLVEAGLLNHIYSVTEGSGGHVMPSNFFTEFKVFALTANGDSLVYDGVNNADWEASGNTADQDFILVVD